jgi:predicted phage-related endonuclease
MTTATLDPRLRAGVGSSEIAALFGLSPYGGPLALYLRIVHHEALPKDETRAQARGLFAEPYLAGAYARRHGLSAGELRAVPTQRHPDNPRLIASPDRVVFRDGIPERIVELKTARDPRGWDDPREVPDGAPPYYLLQVAHQLLVGVDGLDGKRYWPEHATIVASVGHLDDYREYDIQRVPAIEQRIVETVERFWLEHIEPRVPPAFDGSAAGADLLRVLYPYNTIRAKLDDCGPTHPAWPDVVALARAQRAAEAAATEHERMRQVVQSQIGDRAGLVGDDYRLTWRTTAAGTRPFRAVFSPHFGAEGP